MSETDSNDAQPGTVTLLLEQFRAGDRAAFDDLVPLVYEELRALAHLQRRHWQGDHTLDTTALAHEAYIKLAAQAEPEWQSHAHFQAVAARAMRQILIDYAKSKRRLKRGGGQVRVSFDELKMPGSSGPAGDPWSDDAETLSALNASLQRLEELDERQSRVVECRFFGGMTIPDTATALGISPATVKRDWSMARAWLYRDMKQAMEVQGA